MNKNHLMKQAYSKPEFKVINIEPDTHLLESSLQGNHNPADDDEVLNAKPYDSFEEETSKDLWEE